METIVFERGSAFLRKVFAEFPNGNLRVVCPACGEEMVIVLTAEDAAIQGQARGIYCPQGHIKTIFNFR
ncbi:MAG: hypothetical protein ACOYXU_01935 [Nitrospirota bacterium]